MGENSECISEWLLSSSLSQNVRVFSLKHPCENLLGFLEVKFVNLCEIIFSAESTLSLQQLARISI